MSDVAMFELFNISLVHMFTAFPKGSQW